MAIGRDECEDTHTTMARDDEHVRGHMGLKLEESRAEDALGGSSEGQHPANSKQNVSCGMRPSAKGLVTLRGILVPWSTSLAVPS